MVGKSIYLIVCPCLIKIYCAPRITAAEFARFSSRHAFKWHWQLAEIRFLFLCSPQEEFRTAAREATSCLPVTSRANQRTLFTNKLFWFVESHCYALRPVSASLATAGGNYFFLSRVNTWQFLSNVLTVLFQFKHYFNPHSNITHTYIYCILLKVLQLWNQ